MSFKRPFWISSKVEWIIEPPKHKRIKLIRKGHEAGDDRSEARVL
jgi:hypothetical protein